jgi:hypothetical protein
MPRLRVEVGTTGGASEEPLDPQPINDAANSGATARMTPPPRDYSTGVGQVDWQRNVLRSTLRGH